MTEEIGKQLSRQWRKAIDEQIREDNWYRLGGRNPLSGLDCAGFAIWVLSEIGLKHPIRGVNTRGLWDIDIWSRSPDEDAFGRYGKRFSLTWSTDPITGEPPSVGHVSLPYNHLFQVEMTGGYESTGNQQPTSEVVRNMARLLSRYDNGTGGVNTDQMTTDFNAVVADVESVLTDGGYGGEDQSPLLAGFGRVNVENFDGSANLDTLWDWRYRSLDLPSWKESNLWQKVQMIDRTLSEWSGLADIVRTLTPVPVVVSETITSVAEIGGIEFLIDTLAGKSRSEVIGWVVNQMTGKDPAKKGMKNGLRMFPKEDMNYHHINPVTRYLNWNKASEYFDLI